MGTSAPTAALSIKANHTAVGVSLDHDWRPQASLAVLPVLVITTNVTASAGRLSAPVAMRSRGESYRLSRRLVGLSQATFLA